MFSIVNCGGNVAGGILAAIDYVGIGNHCRVKDYKEKRFRRNTFPVMSEV